MMRNPKRTVRLAALFTGLAMVVAACGDDEGGGGGGGGGEGVDLSGKSFTVGSKEFTEQLIVGQMAIQVLENAGAEVDDKTGLVGTETVRTALTSGEIDMYWEYTGTGWTSHLGHDATEASDDPQELFDAVATEDLEQNQVQWFALAPFENTYAIATTSERADELGTATLSDYAEVVNSNPSDGSLCAATEFLTRSDGWPGLEKEYAFDLPDSEIAEVDLGLVFNEVPEGDNCNFGEVFSTDGRIPANDMTLLEDDKGFFVKYNLAMSASQEVYDANPELEELLTPLAEALTTETMQALNAQVDEEGLPAEAVAESWLEENDFLG
uniref:ABC transporter, substrate-binding protein (Cluster 13, osmolytes) n=1 Tax=uncultured Nocardioidaceae bacterium TaxID=253824 RepID=A0A6J4MRJ4_9ACTN|nr:MAG: ABC transporter, substrate-binding protein (cluster 13, osmolytes) [uncultured Nocardioidaceae bacterium]